MFEYYAIFTIKSRLGEVFWDGFIYSDFTKAEEHKANLNKIAASEQLFKSSNDFRLHKIMSDRKLTEKQAIALFEQDRRKLKLELTNQHATLERPLNEGNHRDQPRRNSNRRFFRFFNFACCKKQEDANEIELSETLIVR